MKIKELPLAKASDLASTRPEETVPQVARELTDRNIGALPVVDQSGNLVGIISERDIVRQIVDNANLLSEPVSSIMTKNLITGMPDDDLKIVAGKMTEKRIRHLPVLENDQLVGMVSIGDVVKAQRDQYEGEVDTLQNQLLSNEA